LKPTLKILQFANDKSPDKARASSLFRDLKLGIFHIDREQLRRNGLLNPRHPTILKDLIVRVDGAFQAKDVLDTSALGAHVQPTTSVYKLVCSALVELNTAEEMDHLEPYMLEDGTVASHYWEEWVVFRPMKDFQSLHKHMKGQVAYAEASASTGSRLVGVAAAAFSNASQGRKQRKALIPSLAQATKTAAIAVTRKALMKRGELLDEYIEHFLNPEHLLSRCTEILLFVGAFFPFPSEVRVGFTPTNLVDPMGRTNLLRRVDTKSALDSSMKSEPGDFQIDSPSKRNKDLAVSPSKRNKDLAVSNLSLPMSESKHQDDTELEEDAENSEEMLESILNKVDQVPLAEVRNRMVELLRYQFGFENASFFRSRLLSALETASFVAVTKATDFRKVLYDLHVQHLSPESLANWIKLVLNLLWPDGVWMTKAPTPTPEEERKLAEGSKELLHEGFPEQIRSILGRELTKDGMDMLHEMLQNRLVVKSLFYMLFDMLWIEIFPELRDVLTCASALDIE
jgi:Sorting nexin C terminal